MIFFRFAKHRVSFLMLTLLFLSSCKAIENGQQAINTHAMLDTEFTATAHSITAPGEVVLQVDATDYEENIDHVEFYQDSVKIGEDQTTPYSFTVSNLEAGTYIFHTVTVGRNHATLKSWDFYFDVNEETPQ